jgi:hypothetical protein
MRPILILGLCCLGVAGCLAAAEPIAPHIWSSRQVIDLAPVRPNATAQAEFIIQNLGEATLHLGRVTTTCGCTVVELTSHEVPPRGEVKLKVLYTAGPRPERSSKYIDVENDDPRHPKIRLVLKVRVQADMNWDPQHITLDWPVPDNFTGRITFTGYGTEPVHLANVVAEQGWLRPRIEANDSQEALVLFTLPEKAEFRRQDVIRVETNSKDYPLVEIPVYFQKPSLLTLTPARVSLWMHTDDPPPVRRLAISRKDGKPLTILTVTPSHPGLLAKIVQATGPSAILEITLGRGVAAGPCDGYIRVVTDCETIDVNIPCEVVLREKAPTTP